MTTTTRRLDEEACYRAVSSRDRRFDGVFYTAVRTTGIYCRPSCPARTPALRNVEFHPTAAAAQAAGFRACKRCLPDATPGSPEWDVAADVAGRAMRLISDGVVDREGVDGLAARVGYTPRHLSRLLTAELGAGPLALARARRAQTARVLIETTDLQFADIAFAAGFASIRQFNDTIREVYALAPTDLRGRRGGAHPSTGTVSMRLAVRTPYAGRDAAGVPRACARCRGSRPPGDGWYARTLALPHGTGTVRLDIDGPRPAAGQTAFVHATFALDDLRDTAAGVERVRRLLDADCDPVAVDDVLGRDPLLGPLVRRAARPAGARPRRRQRDRRPCRARPAGHASPRRAPIAGPARRRAGPAGRAARRDADPPVPRRRRRSPRSIPRTCRCRARAAGRWSACAAALADGDVVLDRGAGRDDTRAGPARAARHRSVDRRLRRDAGARRPRRVPAHRHRHPRRAGRSRADPTTRRPPTSPRAGAPGAPTPRCTCGSTLSDPNTSTPDRSTRRH